MTLFPRHCLRQTRSVCAREPTGRANARPMTGSATKQSIPSLLGNMDCFASLATTAIFDWKISGHTLKRTGDDFTKLVRDGIRPAGNGNESALALPLGEGRREGVRSLVMPRRFTRFAG